MPALNFLAQFAEPVKTGKKTSTIRAKRKRPIKPGDRLYLYTGMRTKQCDKLKETNCLSVYDIMIDDGRIEIDGRPLSATVALMLARRDGFEFVTDLVSFIKNRHGLPFYGDLIEW